MPEFDDSAWNSGQEGFGFGANVETDESVQTVLDTMKDNASTLYVRHQFELDDSESASGLIVRMGYNDAFVAYVNGVEVARSNVGEPGTPEPFDATGEKRASRYGVHFAPFDRFPDLLREGAENVLAIQGFNRDIRDRDFFLSQIELLALLPIAGDADADGQVNLADFTILADNFNRAGGWPQGDFDLDGRVQFPDFVILADNFGAMAHPRIAAVPEPSVWVLAFAFLVAMRGWRNRASRNDVSLTSGISLSCPDRFLV